MCLQSALTRPCLCCKEENELGIAMSIEILPTLRLFLPLFSTLTLLPASSITLKFIACSKLIWLIC